MLRKSLLLGLGNPLLDISANTDEAFLEKYGLKSNDAILASDDKHKTMCHDMVEKYDVEYIAGGACQNTLRVAQWILGIPEVCIFMGCIGRDRFGKILENKAREAGINTQYQYDESVPTGTCAVILTKNGTNRSLCAYLAAANCFKTEHIRKPENKKLVEMAEFYYIAGFFLTVSPETILEIAQHSCENNKTFLMNLSAPFLCEVFKDPMMKAMPYVDILFGNETEAETFARVQKLGANDIPTIALRISELPKENKKRRIVVITQGPLPIIVAKDGEITEYPVSQLSPENLVDTNGAGDAFVGGFLAQFVQGKSMEICIECGIYAAQEIVKQSGCTIPSVCNFRN